MFQTKSTVLKFSAKVIETDGTIARRVFDGELNETGVTLSRKGVVIIQIPQQAQWELVKGSSVRVVLPNQAFVFRVIKATGYVDKIAQAIISLPTRKQIPFDPRDYEFPKWLLGIAVLPLLLVPIGGAIGGACGATATAINFAFARREKWPTPLRVLAMLGSGMIGVCCYFSVAILLMGRGTKSQIARPAVYTPETPLASSPTQIEKSGPAVHGTYKQFMEKGVLSIPDNVPGPLCACTGEDNESIIVGHRDGSLNSYSVSKGDDGWHAITKLPGPIDCIQRLSQRYLIAQSAKSNFLIDPSTRIFRFPCRWVSISHTGGLMALHNRELILGSLNYQRLEEVIKANSSSAGPAIVDLPMSVIQSEASSSGVKFPFNGNEEEIVCLGRGSVSVGYRNGESEIWASGAWISGDFRPVGVTVIGTGCGTGYADGVVDTGRLGPGRYRQCGSYPIVSLVKFQAWHLAINAIGEVWAWFPNVEDEPHKVRWRENIEPVRAIVELSTSIAVVGDHSVNFYSPPTFGALLK